jgi:hypothetical protein
MGIEETQEQTAQNQHWARWRLWTIRICYALLSVWALLMAQWGFRLWQADPGYHFGYGSVTAWKLLAVGGVFAICLTAGRSVVAFYALMVGWASWFLAERLYPAAPEEETGILSILTTVVLWLLPLVLLRPNRRELLRPELRPSAILLPLALVAAVPLLIYSVRQGRTDQDSGILGVAVAAQAVLAALRPRHTRWLPRFVALAAGSIGLLAVIWPDDLGSPGRAWGAALIGWALLFAAAAEVEARRDPKPDVRPETTATTRSTSANMFNT